MKKQNWSVTTYHANPRNNTGPAYHDTKVEAIRAARLERAYEETGACVHVHRDDQLVASRYLHKKRLTWHNK
jgi:hypothetical protein